MNVCAYGCGKEAKFFFKNGKHCCSKNVSSCEAVRYKNSESLKKTHKLRSLRSFTGSDRKKSNEARIKKAILFGFVEGSTLSNAAVKRYLINNFNYEEKCGCCEIKNWNNASICFELDHINGVSSDNRIENLRLLCPNCHSQTKNFRGKNINSGKEKVPELQFVEVLKRSKNVRRALLRLKLAPKGANYEKAYFLIRKYNITMSEII